MITETKDKENYCINVSGFEFEITLSSYIKSENVLPLGFSFSMKYTARLWRGKEYFMGNQECVEKEQKKCRVLPYVPLLHGASSVERN